MHVAYSLCSFHRWNMICFKVLATWSERRHICSAESGLEFPTPTLIFN